MAGNSIYYMFGTPPQTGGHFVAMEHVAALNALGFDAKAFFHQPGPEVARLGIPVAAPGTRIQPNDIVVVGEADGPVLDPLYTAVCMQKSCTTKVPITRPLVLARLPGSMRSDSAASLCPAISVPQSWPNWA